MSSESKEYYTVAFEYARRLTVASLATIEQAGGRLCRVGITYRGTLSRPTAAADALLASVQGNAAGVPSTEAASMEAAFVAALN
jgi:hypothetical protein